MLDWMDALPEASSNPCGCDNPSSVILKLAPFRGRGMLVDICARCYAELVSRENKDIVPVQKTSPSVKTAR